MRVLWLVSSSPSCSRPSMLRHAPLVLLRFGWALFGGTLVVFTAFLVLSNVLRSYSAVSLAATVVLLINF